VQSDANGLNNKGKIIAVNVLPYIFAHRKELHHLFWEWYFMRFLDPRKRLCNFMPILISMN